MPTQKPSERIKEICIELMGDKYDGTISYDIAIKAILEYLDEAQKEEGHS